MRALDASGRGLEVAFTDGDGRVDGPLRPKLDLGGGARLLTGTQVLPRVRAPGVVRYDVFCVAARQQRPTDLGGCVTAGALGAFNTYDRSSFTAYVQVSCRDRRPALVLELRPGDELLARTATRAVRRAIVARVGDRRVGVLRLRHGDALRSVIRRHGAREVVASTGLPAGVEQCGYDAGLDGDDPSQRDRLSGG